MTSRVIARIALPTTLSQYLAQVVRLTRQNVKDGYLLQPDADRTVDEAQASRVGQQGH